MAQAGMSSSRALGGDRRRDVPDGGFARIEESGPEGKAGTGAPGALRCKGLTLPRFRRRHGVPLALVQGGAGLTLVQVRMGAAA